MNAKAFSYSRVGSTDWIWMHIEISDLIFKVFNYSSLVITAHLIVDNQAHSADISFEHMNALDDRRSVMSVLRRLVSI